RAAGSRGVRLHCRTANALADPQRRQRGAPLCRGVLPLDNVFTQAVSCPQMKWIKFAAAFVIVVAATTVGFTQGRGRGGPGYLKLFDSNMPFEPHDLAGIWTPNGNGFGGGGRCRDCGDRGYSMEFPEFTPAGQAAFDKNIPSYGRAK